MSDIDFSTKFTDAYSQGKTNVSDIDKYVEHWNSIPGEKDSLQSFLGLNDTETLLWMKKNETELKKALDSRKQPVIKAEDVQKTTIRFYDSKTKSRRFMLVADTTANNELVCFNITTSNPDNENEKISGAVYIPKSSENKLKYDSYVKCF